MFMQVVAAVEKGKDGFRVHVSVEDDDAELQISWWALKWQSAWRLIIWLQRL